MQDYSQSGEQQIILDYFKEYIGTCIEYPHTHQAGLIQEYCKKFGMKQIFQNAENLIFIR